MRMRFTLCRCWARGSQCWPAPHRNPMPPPELAADAPVADVLVPRLEGPGVAGGVEAELALPVICGTGLQPVLAAILLRSAFSCGGCLHGLSIRAAGSSAPIHLIHRHRAQGRPAQTIIGHAAVPLITQVRLDRHMAAI